MITPFQLLGDPHFNVVGGTKVMVGASSGGGNFVERRRKCEAVGRVGERWVREACGEFPPV